MSYDFIFNLLFKENNVYAQFNKINEQVNTVNNSVNKVSNTINNKFNLIRFYALTNQIDRAGIPNLHELKKRQLNSG